MVVFLIAILVNTSTLAPTVTLVDSGELIVAARFLGVAHPPGFPLYLMLAHLASLVPIGNVAERINFGSKCNSGIAVGARWKNSSARWWPEPSSRSVTVTTFSSRSILRR